MGNVIAPGQQKKTETATSSTPGLPDATVGAACSSDIASLGDVVVMKRQTFISKTQFVCPSDMTCLPKVDTAGKVLVTTYTDAPATTATATDTATNTNTEGYASYERMRMGRHYY